MRPHFISQARVSHRRTTAVAAWGENMLHILTAVPRLKVRRPACGCRTAMAPDRTPSRRRWPVVARTLLLWCAVSAATAAAPPFPLAGQGAALGTSADAGAAGLPVTPAFVCTADLELALAAGSPEGVQRRAEVSRREGELRLAELGLSTVLSVTSGVDVGANLLREEAAAWDTTLQLDAALGYRYDEVAVVRARTALTTARKREAEQRRADVLNALIQLSRLRAAQRQWTQAEGSATEAESLAASVRRSAITTQAAALGSASGPSPAAAEQGPEPATDSAPAGPPGSAPDLAFVPAPELDHVLPPDLPPDLALNIRELDLAAARARATATGRAGEAATALAELERLGVPLPAVKAHADRITHTGPVACLAPAAGTMNRAGGPALPQPEPGLMAERLLLVHATDLAAARNRRATLGPLRDLSLTAHYQEGGARVRAEVELDGGRPGAGVDLRLRPAAAHSWGVGLAATIRLDDTMGPALAAAAAELEAAQAALAEFDTQLPARVTAQTAAVGSAWLQLAFAVEAVSIAAERMQLAVSEGAPEKDVARAEQVLSRSVDALEREYQAYLRALGRYLAEFDMAWSDLALDD